MLKFDLEIEKQENLKNKIENKFVERQINATRRDPKRPDKL